MLVNEVMTNLEIPGLAGAARDDVEELLVLELLPRPLVDCLTTWRGDKCLELDAADITVTRKIQSGQNICT